MTVQEYLDTEQHCVDMYDTVYDACVTVDYIPQEEKDTYSRFCRKLYSKVAMSGRCALWTELIEKNIDKFNEFATEHWGPYYEDRNEYIYQWICEINNYIAGYVPESFYKKLLDFVNTLEPVY